MLGLFRSTLYVRIAAQRLALLHVESGREFADTPLLALDASSGKPVVVGVGSEAAAKAGLDKITVANGFDHPRTLLADFTIAEQTLRQFVVRIVPRSLFAPAPVIVLHPLEKLEGGLTQIEARALAELGRGAGARQVFVWEGPALSVDELRTLDFPATGKLHA
jgi:rod shape-determining protein MreB